MSPTFRIPVLLLSLFLVQSSIARPQTSVVDPLFCTLCTLTALPFPCASRGIEFAVQQHNFFKDGTDGQPMAPFDISYFHTAPAFQSGYTKRIGSNTQPGVDYSIYGGPTLGSGYTAINHRAYFLAPADGLYTLTASSPDEAVFVWVGGKAYNGNYNNENPDLELLLFDPAAPFTFQAYKNTPIALRILFINGDGDAEFGIELTNAAGKVIFGANAVVDTPFFIPYTCDCTSPPFQEWGKETVGSGSSTGCGLLGRITSGKL